jgi:hypothetical protein
MSAIPLRQEASQPICVLKLYNTPYTLDPYHDRLESQGYKVIDGSTYKDALTLAHEHRPLLILVYDDPEQGVDALKWLEIQHTDRYSWMATTPLLILADSARLSLLRAEELPDRVVVLQRRADTLNQLTHMVKYLLRVWDLE